MYRNHPGLPPIRQAANFRQPVRAHPITRNGFTVFFHGTQDRRDALEETEIQDMINDGKAQARARYAAPRGHNDAF